MLNHCVFTVLHVHPCGCSFFVSLCLEGPTVSHLEGSLCLPPVYSANKNSCLSCTTASHACFLPFLQTENNNESAATGREKKQQHLAQRRTRTPPHESLGTMKPHGLEGRKMRRNPPPHSSCYFQLLALRCHWHLRIRASDTF